jgi:hypothetical protein
MKKRLFLLSVASALLAFLFILPGPVFGQGNTWAGTSLAQTVEAAKWRLGALRVNAALELMNAGYDSDIYYGYLNAAVPDYTFSAGAPVQFLLPLSKKVVLEVFDSPQYMFYLDTMKERAWNNMFRGRVHFAFDRLYIQAGGGLSNIRQRLSPELNINVRQKEDSLNGTILWQASREMSFALIYGGSQFDYGDAAFGGTSLDQTLNRKENYFDFVTYFQPSSRVRLFVDGQYGSFRFADEASSAKDTRSYGVFGGLAFIPREGEARPVEPVKGSIRLGYKRFDILDPLLTDGSGFVGAVDISAGLLNRTTGRAFFSSDFSFSAYSGGTFYLSTTYGGGISRRLAKRTTFSYDLSFSRSSYPKVNDGGIPAGQNFRYATHSFSLNLSLARNLGVTFLGTLSKRGLNTSGQGRSRNFFGLSLVYGNPSGTISAPARGLSR